MHGRRLGVVSAIAGLAIASAASASSPDREWEASAQRGLAEREYWASATESGLQAPNRAHDLRTWFEHTGIRVDDRTAPGSPELLRLSLSAVGRAGALAAALPGTAITNSKGRVEVRRPGIVEWYENGPRGLEQGFTLPRRPPGRGPLVLELAVTGARPSLRGDEVVLDAGGRHLRYGALRAVDGAGRRLPARLAVSGRDRIRIVVDDAHARWPVTVDPLLTSTPDALLEANQAAASFGWSVAGGCDVNGDGYADVIVGAPTPGAAYVFHGGPTGIADATGPTATTQITGGSDSFGTSVAGAGDVNGDGFADVIVGAPNFSATQNAEGGAFVYFGSALGVPNSSEASADVRLVSGQASALLGQSVASAGDVNKDGGADVIVGAYLYETNPPTDNDEGVAFVYYGVPEPGALGAPLAAIAALLWLRGRDRS